MLDRLLSPTVQDEETAVRAKALNLSALAIALMAPLYALVTVIAAPGQLTAAVAAGLGAGFLMGLGCFWLGKRGRFRLAAYLFLTGLFVAISVYFASRGSTIADLSMAPMIYLLVILPAGFVVHPRASVVLTTLAFLYTVILLLLAPPPAYLAYENRGSFWSNLILAFAIAYVLSAITWVFSQGLAGVLGTARDQNRELERTARELARQRQAESDTGARILELADQLAEFSRRQARGSSRQASAVEQVSKSIEQLDNAVREIAQSANIVDLSAQQTLSGAQEGQDILDRNCESMNRIVDQAEQGVQEATTLDERLAQINDVATIISNIASQIQLVAFNATLEAAEAGEAGQRFGVVAAEFKGLAASSLQRAKEVADVIRQVQDAGDIVVQLSNEQVRAVQEGTALMDRSRTANEAIIESASQMAGQARQIQQTTAQQQQASEQVVTAMGEVKAVMDRWVVSSHQMDTLVSNLQALAGQRA